MSFRRISITILAGFLVSPLFGQEKDKRLEKWFGDRPEMRFSIPYSKYKSAYPFINQLSIDQLGSDSIWFYASRKDSVILKLLEADLKKHPAPSLVYNLKPDGTIEDVLNGLAYPSWQQYNEIMNFFEETWPDFCTIDTIGYSVKNRPITAARISAPAVSSDTHPVVLLTGTIHGDEVVGYSLLILLIKDILSNKDLPEYNKLLQEAVIIINPLSNPDGTYYVSEASVSGATRGNSNFVDLNRNYPDPQDGLNPDGNERQAENIAMMEYMDKYPPLISANYHGGAQLVNYPYDTWSTRHFDDAWFRYVSRQYADTANHYLSGYFTGFDQGIVNGFEWYEINGGRQDYVTYFLRGRELTLEISNQKMPPESSILTYWNANKHSMLNYLKLAGYGLHGWVYDSISKQALKAEIILNSPAPPESTVFSRMTDGSFYRYAKGGNYSLTVNAEGYYPRNFPSLTLSDNARTNLRIPMLPVTYVPDTLSLNIGPNPFSEHLRLQISNPVEEYAFVKIYDLSGCMRKHRFYQITQGYSETLIDTGGLDSGLYLLEVKIGNKIFRFKIVKA